MGRLFLRRPQCEGRFYKILSDQEYTTVPHYTIRSTDTVIDIGGNIGVFALHAGRQARRVLTFEPVADNFALLRENLDKNRAGNVTPFRMAVGDREGDLRIFLTPAGHEATGSHSIDPVMVGNIRTRYEDVTATTLPAIFPAQSIERCHFLKIDCEGAEYVIFEATPSAIFQRIDRLVMEYHTHTRDSDMKHQAALPLLERLVAEGFRIDDYLDSVGIKSGFIRARRP